MYVSNNNGTSFQKALIPSSQPIPYLFPNQILDDRSESVWIGGKNNKVMSLDLTYFDSHQLFMEIFGELKREIFIQVIKKGTNLLPSCSMFIH